MTTNALYYGDNLDILREHIEKESIDLIYLDPPFNSKRDYNVLFKSPKGQSSDAQITAFEDSWVWGDQAEREFTELLRQQNTNVSEMIQHMRQFLNDSPIMAYLVMMANRLVELHRVLKPTGSLYLHCDPTASHYLKIILDTIFNPKNFQNEITWKRANAHNDPKKYGNISDIIFFYTKTERYTWNTQFTQYDEKYIQSHWQRTDANGRRYRLMPLDAPRHGDGGNLVYDWHGKFPAPTRTWACVKEKMQEYERQGSLAYTNTGTPCLKKYIDEMPGAPVQNIWDDIPPVNPMAAERLGYPTQKPLALLERIIEASSNPGDVVLDPFCGCGTAVHAAQKLGRPWIGIDITHLAISLIEKRMRDAFPGIQFDIHGTPKDIGGARDLAERDKYQFQWWACSLVNAQPYQGKKKGADTGIDGMIFFQDDTKTVKKIIISVKGGEHVSRTMIADLKNSVEREGAQIGLFVTLTPPTGPMEHEAVTAGYYHSPLYGDFKKIQILTIEGLLSGAERPEYPDLSRGSLSFKKAQVEKKKGVQPGLGFDEI